MPERVPQRFISGICVSCNESEVNVRKLLTGVAFSVKISIKPDLFFQAGKEFC